MKLFKGKKKGFVHTTDITLDDIRAIFFPRNFYEKFRYLGSIPSDDSEVLLQHFTIVMDYYAKPWYIPRWVLRFLHLFGNDNSVVRLRNIKLHNLHRKLTKGFFIYDYKYKWNDYDLRISASCNKELDRLEDSIIHFINYEGARTNVLEKLSKIPNVKFSKYDSLCELLNIYNDVKDTD